jgi:hypothetical protein
MGEDLPDRKNGWNAHVAGNGRSSGDPFEGGFSNGKQKDRKL